MPQARSSPAVLFHHVEPRGIPFGWPTAPEETWRPWVMDAPRLVQPTTGQRQAEVIMCLACGCMDAHREMGTANINYKDVKAAADENGRSVADVLDIVDRTVAKDRGEHSEECASGS